MMYILNILSALKKITIKELRDFIFENYYRRIEFRKKIVVQWNILSDEDNTKLVKLSKVTTQQPKPIENQIIVDIKLVILEHLKTSHKLPEAITQAEKIPEPDARENSNSPLYSDTKKWKCFG